ncbi:MAG: pentapeptide repeat-containing protein [Pleurocapsa sp.]
MCFDNGNFVCSSFEWANFHRANFYGADFTGANLEKAIFDRQFIDQIKSQNQTYTTIYINSRFCNKISAAKIYK